MPGPGPAGRGAAKPELTTPCHRGSTGEACIYEHVAVLFERGRSGARNYRLCPVHGGSEASISINPGHTYRAVWRETHARCEIDALDIRALLIAGGAHESCLGTYGLPRRAIVPGLQVGGSQDPALVAGAKRSQAIAKLSMVDLSGHRYKMCVQAILDGDGDLVGDPFRLLPDTKADFIDLARRCGFDRSYARKLWIEWSAELQAYRSAAAGL